MCSRTKKNENEEAAAGAAGQQEQQYLALRTEPTISFWTTGEIHNAEPSKTHCFLDSFRDVPAIAA